MSALTAALRRRLDPRSEQGVSLVELIVTMMVMGVVLTIVASMFINVAKVTGNANGSNVRSSVAANVMNEMTEVIRLAANNAISTSDTPDAAIVAGTATSLTVYSYVDTSATNPAPTKVTFRVDSSGNVFEDRVAATASGSYWVFTGATTSRNLGGPVVASGIFTYYNAAGDTVALSSSSTAGVRSSVTSIKVTVNITNTTTLGADPVILVNTVGMPNLLLTGSDS